METHWSSKSDPLICSIITAVRAYSKIIIVGLKRNREERVLLKAESRTSSIKERTVLVIFANAKSRKGKQLHLLDLGPSASQSFDGDASAASRILVVSFLQVCLFWATDLKRSRSFRLVSCSLSSDTRVRSLLKTTGSVTPV